LSELSLFLAWTVPLRVGNVPRCASAVGELGVRDQPAKIAIFVPRLRFDSESVHQNNDHDGYDDARPRRSYREKPWALVASPCHRARSKWPAPRSRRI